MQSKIVILGTGGTIAGPRRADTVGYISAQLGVRGVGCDSIAAQVDVECEQVAQPDSKDMDRHLKRLAQRAAFHLRARRGGWRGRHLRH
jgi:L-asparaginase/Glu-tRNA(Gln) amidotransferase subunit D